MISICHLVLFVSVRTGQKTHAATITSPSRLDREDNERFVGIHRERIMEELEIRGRIKQKLFDESVSRL
jgi:hypothetical protein